ncbi:transport and Golgi organization protein 6 homolog [Neocloeon triangulifer]|uniref:transport and Golgi organization protein 6 homolog n=1 Tax=Neocloeon triangulifer TaxID=2078957 RepID=UPI00286F707E|nr:transport and Golgi organization protein 6 homolog [Neocloeon triangulifer]
MASTAAQQTPADDFSRLFAGLSALVTTPDRDKIFKSVDSSLQMNISEAIVALGREKLHQCLAPLIEKFGPIPEDEKNPSETSWDFSCLILCIFLQLNVETLLSVQQKTLLKSAAQFLSALGIGPFLQPGVGVPLESRCNAPVTFPRNNPDKLGYLLKVLLFLMEDKKTDLNPILSSNLLLDVLAGLFQLSQEDRKFKVLTGKFVRSIHQPTVIRHLLMLLKPNPKTPKWCLITTSSHLNKCLMAPGGVIATVRALHDVDSEQSVIDKYSKTARIILQPDFTKNEEYYKNLCPQVLELLASGQEEYKKVASEMVQQLYQKNEEFCRKEIFTQICQVFNQDFGDLEGSFVLDADQEKNLTFSVQTLLLLISHSKISPDCLKNYFPNFCAFYLATRKTGGTPSMRALTKELLSQVIMQAEETEIWQTIATLPEECLESLSEESSVAQALFSNFLKRFSSCTDLEEKILLGSLLGALAGLPSVQNEFMKNPSQQFIDLLKNLLENEKSEILELALMLLMAIISQSEENLRKCQVLLPAVKKLRDFKHGSSETQTMIEQIFMIIATFGAVSGDTLLVEEKLKDMLKEKKKVEEVMNPSAGPAQLSFENSLAEVEDEEIPVKGHGFLSLTKLIRKKDAKTRVKTDELFMLGLRGMEHEDSYVYLAAIGMIGALILENLSLLQKLAEKYNQSELSISLRNRIGESLLQVCKGLGEVAASQRQILLNAYLVGAKDPNPVHRASSLSNLGEACKVLGFRVSGDIQEILTCAQGLSTSDPDIHVRRAAALLLALLLQGLGTQAVSTLGSSSLEVYRTMKQLAQSEDQTLRLQAQLALEELNKGIKDSIFEPKPMEKHIYITSAPPN